MIQLLFLSKEIPVLSSQHFTFSDLFILFDNGEITCGFTISLLSILAYLFLLILLVTNQEKQNKMSRSRWIDRFIKTPPKKHENAERQKCFNLFFSTLGNTNVQNEMWADCLPTVIH